MFGLKKSGFTLVELLVVIGVVASLATSLIAIINPLENIRKSNDTIKIANINTIGQALKTYSVSNPTYPVPVLLAQTLTTTGNLLSFPTNPSDLVYSCSSVAGQGAELVNGYCYNASSPPEAPSAVLYVPLESNKEIGNCIAPATAWYVWSTLIGQSGRHCTASETDEPPPNLLAFDDTPPVIPTGSIPTSTPTNTPAPTSPPPVSTNTPAPTVTSTPEPTLEPTATPTNTPVPTPTPTTAGPTVILNSATNLTCAVHCANNGYATCLSVGVDAGGTTSNMWRYSTSCSIGAATCTTTMANSGQVCGGLLSRWTNCRCQ